MCGYYRHCGKLVTVMKPWLVSVKVLLKVKLQHVYLLTAITEHNTIHLNIYSHKIHITCTKKIGVSKI